MFVFHWVEVSMKRGGANTTQKNHQIKQCTYVTEIKMIYVLKKQRAKVTYIHPDSYLLLFQEDGSLKSHVRLKTKAVQVWP